MTPAATVWVDAGPVATAALVAAGALVAGAVVAAVEQAAASRPMRTMPLTAGIDRRTDERDIRFSLGVGALISCTAPERDRITT